MNVDNAVAQVTGTFTGRHLTSDWRPSFAGRAWHRSPVSRVADHWRMDRQSVREVEEIRVLCAPAEQRAADFPSVTPSITRGTGSAGRARLRTCSGAQSTARDCLTRSTHGTTRCPSLA